MALSLDKGCIPWPPQLWNLYLNCIATIAYGAWEMASHPILNIYSVELPYNITCRSARKLSRSTASSMEEGRRSNQEVALWIVSLRWL